VQSAGKRGSCRLNKEHETIIYRILQESISNILRHSHSETIDIAFNIKNCRITIADSGKGFDCEKDSKGNGLNNIATRAELIGAAFDIRSELGKGSQITIDYPIKMAPESL